MPPNAPGYSVNNRFWFWISNPCGSRGGCGGIRVRSVCTYRRKSGRSNNCRAINAKSYALVNCPGPSKPDGVTAWVCHAPSLRASSFINRSPPATPSGPPPNRASTLAASLPELSNSPSQSVSTEYSPPTSSPTAELPGSKPMSSSVTSTIDSGSSRSSNAAANSNFCVEAGIPYSCGPHPPSTSPVSRSATNQEVADNRSPGTGGASGGTTNPAVANASPPTRRSPGAKFGGDAGGSSRTGGVPTSATGHGTYSGRGSTADAGPTVTTGIISNASAPLVNIVRKPPTN